MNLESILEQQFGFTSFRPGQKEVVSSILAKQHTLAMLPTGTGKSLCYQMPTYILNKPTLIVSPLLSLMHDQAEQMKVNGEKSVLTFNSFLSPQQKVTALNQLSSFRFIFISPEMLALKNVVTSLRKIDIGLFVIDEAHCISQWGYDFRPDYLNLGDIRQQLGNPLTLALTATATEDVRNDILEKLDIGQANQIISSVDRDNIALLIEKRLSYEDKVNRLYELVLQLNGSGIIYFSSKKVAEAVCEELQAKGVDDISFYHGGMEQDQRMLIQQQFISGQLRLICATSAFGMGINKADVRFVLHFHLPATMEAYLQEIGRTGRDGKQSVAVLLYQDGDEGLPIHLIEQQLPADAQIEAVYSYLVSTRKDMTALTKSEQELLCQQYQLNEIQYRLLTQYLGHPPYKLSTMESLKDYCHTIIRRNRVKLDIFLNWLKSNECRREGIRKYFAEEGKKDALVCCDCCGVKLEDVRLLLPKGKSKSNSQKENWKDVLTSILLTTKYGGEVKDDSRV